MQETLFEQGLVLMVAGMGTVFVFLTGLVIAMTSMSAIIARFQPESSDLGDEEIAAIAAAIKQHRKR